MCVPENIIGVFRLLTYADFCSRGCVKNLCVICEKS